MVRSTPEGACPVLKGCGLPGAVPSVSCCVSWSRMLSAPPLVGGFEAARSGSFRRMLGTRGGSCASASWLRAATSDALSAKPISAICIAALVEGHRAAERQQESTICTWSIWLRDASCVETVCSSSRREATSSQQLHCFCCPLWSVWKQTRPVRYAGSRYSVLQFASVALTITCDMLWCVTNCQQRDPSLDHSVWGRISWLGVSLTG